MNKNHRSLRELSECKFEDLTEEEKDSLLSIFKAISLVEKSLKAYEGIDIDDNNNTPIKIFKKQSDEYYVMAIVLESFFYCIEKEISFKELNNMICTFAPKDMLEDTSSIFVKAVIGKMIFLSLIEPIKTDNEHIPNFKITEDGIRAFQEHRFQDLSMAAFSNYQSYKTNERLLCISWLSLITAIVSVIIAVIAVIISTAN